MKIKMTLKFLKSKLSLRVELPFLANLECYGPAGPNKL